MQRLHKHILLGILNVCVSGLLLPTQSNASCEKGTREELMSEGAAVQNAPILPYEKAAGDTARDPGQAPELRPHPRRSSRYAWRKWGANGLVTATSTNYCCYPCGIQALLESQMYFRPY